MYKNITSIYKFKNVYSGSTNFLKYTHSEKHRFRFLIKQPVSFFRPFCSNTIKANGSQLKYISKDPDNQYSNFFTEKKNKMGIFVNILMKHGKKSKALYLLEVSVYIFMQNLSKIKMSLSKSLNTKTVPQLYITKTGIHGVSPFLPFSHDVYKKGRTNTKHHVFLCEKTMFLKKKKFGERVKKYLFRKDHKATFRETSTRYLYFYEKKLPLFTPKRYISIFQEFYVLKMFFYSSGFSYNKKTFLAPCSLFSESLRGCFYKRFQENGIKRPYISYRDFKKQQKSTSTFDKTSILPSKTRIYLFWYRDACENSKLWEGLTIAQKNTRVFSLYKAIANVKPPLECRNKRFGGTYRQIPATVSEHRQYGYAIRWIIEAAQNSFSKTTSFVPLLQHKNQESEKKTKTPKQESPFSQNSMFSPSKVSQDTFDTFRNKDIEKKRLQTIEKGAYSTYIYKTKSSKIIYKTPLKVPLFCFFLADALANAYYKRGYAVQKRNLWIETATANRAYLHFRWW